MGATVFAESIGSIPENYDRYLGPILFEPYALDIVGRIDPSTTKILELACGTGRLTKYLQALVSDEGKVIATDLNQEMLSIAQKRLADKANIKWQVANAQELPFEDDAFPIVICQYGVMFFPDKLKAFQEAYRVLEPEGRFIFNTWHSMENNMYIQVAKEAVHSFFPSDPPDFYRAPFSFYRPEEIKALLSDAGFDNIRIIPVRKNALRGSAANAARGLIYGNKIFSYISERDATLLPAITDAVRDALASEFGDEPMQATLNAFVCEGSKPR